MPEDDDLLDGCEGLHDLSMDEIVKDEDIDGIVLFADVAGDPEAIEARRKEWLGGA